MRIGAFTSISGGFHNACIQGAQIGAEVVHIFLRNPRGRGTQRWGKDAIALFQHAQKEYNIAAAYAHSPYMINLASPKKTIWGNSIKFILRDLRVAEALGIKHYVTHIGGHVGSGPAAGLRQIKRALAEIIKNDQTNVHLLLENTAGSGTALGNTFEELADLIDHASKASPRSADPTNKVGMTLDTAHAFAMGYDLRTPAKVLKTLDHLDSTVGLNRVQLIHSNDSKADFESRVDRHAHIGRGQIGLPGFRALLSDPRLRRLDLIIENPHDFIRRDIRLLKEIRDQKWPQKRKAQAKSLASQSA